ncbi:putative trafficking protein particle complex subunit [Clavispora lusitaniae]|uniref:Trafficking protein particle complex subunit n=1 Tax=Clavispora lusitaniae TaxID=36911 RepID=A0AA91T4S8_CLALS|nr:putative trafficking protein particle complex subunit [Clavispora lusitaniae]
MSDLLDSSSKVNAVCLDLLLQEVIPTSVRVSSRLSDSSAAPEQNTTITTPLSSVPNDLPGSVAVFSAENLASDDVALRIDAIGFSLGLRLTEVLMYKAPTQTKADDILDIMKFVCRDVWRCLYGKQMDNLRTNHRGTFVLVDNNHRLVARLSSAAGTSDTNAKANVFLWFPCGIIRGILSSFGISAYITAECSQLPAVTFNIQTSINN